MKPDLQNLLSYKHTAVIARYERDYPQSTLTADQAWQELLKFIWLCRQHKVDKLQQPHNENLAFTCIIYREMRAIDEMWHTFLLFTYDYQAFCKEHLNGNFSITFLQQKAIH